MIFLSLPRHGKLKAAESMNNYRLFPSRVGKVLEHYCWNSQRGNKAFT